MVMVGAAAAIDGSMAVRERAVDFLAFCPGLKASPPAVKSPVVVNGGTHLIEIRCSSSSRCAHESRLCRD